MPHPVQRSACDRCHGQKLRCIRAASAGACVRCTKANSICTFSPSLRRQRKPPSASRPASSMSSVATPALSLASPEKDKDMFSATAVLSPRFDQPEMDFDLGVNIFQPSAISWTGSNSTGAASGSSPSFPASTDFPQHTSPFLSQDALDTWQQRFNREWAMLSASDAPVRGDSAVENAPSPYAAPSQGASSLPALATVRGLSDLNVELYTLSSVIPKPPTDISQPLSWKDKDFAIDKTFQLSQRFIEVLNKLYPRFLETAPLRSGDSMSSSNSESSLSALPPTPSFDQASFLLVLSCYQRLVDAYDDIFGNMQACLNRSSTTAREDYVQMPDVRVGGFSLPNSSALQITLILQLARHLLRRMGDIIKCVDSSFTAMSADGLHSTNDLTSLTLKAVYSRESDLIARINTLRNTLVSLNIL